MDQFKLLVLMVPGSFMILGIVFLIGFFNHIPSFIFFYRQIEQKSLKQNLNQVLISRPGRIILYTFHKFIYRAIMEALLCIIL